MSAAEIFYHLVLLSLGGGIGWVLHSRRAAATSPTPPEPDPLIEPLRGHLASLRAALETLEMYPDHERSEPLRAIVREELGAVAKLLDRGDEPMPHPSEPQDARGLIAALHRALPGQLTLESTAPDLALAIDTAELTAAVSGVLMRLQRDFGVAQIAARLHREQDFAHLDLAWSHEGLDLEALCAWQSEAILAPGPEGGPGLKECARRHGGEAWFNLDRTRSRAYFRVLLPVGASAPT